MATRKKVTRKRSKKAANATQDDAYKDATPTPKRPDDIGTAYDAPPESFTEQKQETPPTDDDTPMPAQLPGGRPLKGKGLQTGPTVTGSANLGLAIKWAGMGYLVRRAAWPADLLPIGDMGGSCLVHVLKHPDTIEKAGKREQKADWVSLKEDIKATDWIKATD